MIAPLSSYLNGFQSNLFVIDCIECSFSPAEFGGNLKILQLEYNLLALSNLKVLNLYDNHLTHLDVK